MSTILWRGDSPAIAQLDTITPASVGIGNTFTITINGKAVTYTAVAATVADVVAGLSALLIASTIPEFKEITWTASGTAAIMATATTAGVPFTQASSASGGTATLTTAHTTASSGPADASVASNYSTGSLPTNGDDLFFENTANPCLYGLSSLSAVTLNSLSVRDTFTSRTAAIGLPLFNSGGYKEYRATYLQIGATTINIYDGTSSGCGRIKIDTGSAQTTINCYSTGAAIETGIPAFLWKGTHASNAATIYKGSFGAAFFDGEVATLATLKVGFVKNINGDATVVCSSGVTLTTVTQDGGKVEINSATTTDTVNAGTRNHYGGAPTTLTINGGVVNYRSSGTIGALNGFGGAIDFSANIAGCTITNGTLYNGFDYNDPIKSVTWTNPLAFKCPVSKLKRFEIGTSFSLQRS
jgi:hypothetical protein